MSLRVYVDQLLTAAEGRAIWERRRIIQRGHYDSGPTLYDKRHYLAVLQRKPWGFAQPGTRLGLFRRVQAPASCAA